MLSSLLMLTMAAAPVEDPNKARTQDGNTPRTADSTANVSLDGNWTIVCLEKDGQPQPDAKNMTVMAKGDTITCSGKDGKPAMTWKLTFADKGRINVTSTDANTSGQPQANAGEAKSGVYVLTNDVLAICVHDAKAGTETSAAGTAGSPQVKSHCSIILKREGASRTDR